MKIESRDYLFVVIQFALFFAYLPNWDRMHIEFPDWLERAGLLVAILGTLMLMIALLQLNTYLSPFPTPKPGARLQSQGLYKYIRHPIYAGILWAVFGGSLYLESGYKLLVSSALLILFYRKTKYEEKRLMQAYPDYVAYRKTAGRFLPKG